MRAGDDKLTIDFHAPYTTHVFRLSFSADPLVSNENFNVFIRAAGTNILSFASYTSICRRAFCKTQQFKRIVSPKIAKVHSNQFHQWGFNSLYVQLKLIVQTIQVKLSDVTIIWWLIHISRRFSAQPCKIARAAFSKTWYVCTFIVKVGFNLNAKISIFWVGFKCEPRRIIIFWYIIYTFESRSDPSWSWRERFPQICNSAAK